jgi:hypothetical protein
MFILSLTKKPRKSRLWQFDPAVFQPGPKPGFFQRRILNPAKSLGKHALYALAFAYPALLVSLGIIFGGLVFWTSLAASMGIIWLVITKTGYSGNFAGWDISYRKFLGLILGLCMLSSLFYGLLYLKLWETVPIMAGSLVFALILGIWKTSNR